MKDWYTLVNDLETPVVPLDDLAAERVLRRVRREVRPRKQPLRRLVLLAAAVLALTVGGYAAVTGQFSTWFWNLSQDLEQPQASESLFAQLGTAIGQTQTAGEVTMTLDGALWDGEYLFLSLTVEGLPRENYYGRSVGSGDSYLGVSKESALNAWKAAQPQATQEELEDYWESVSTFQQPELLYVHHHTTDTYSLQVQRKLSGKEEKELTLHLENLDFDSDTVEGPFDFTFTLSPKDLNQTYTGETVVEGANFPALQVTEVRISPFSTQVDFTTVDPEAEVTLKNVKIRTLRLQDGEENTGSSGNGLRMTIEEDGAKRYTLTDGPFRQVLDPREVTAVSLGDTWLELSNFTRTPELP